MQIKCTSYDKTKRVLCAVVPKTSVIQYVVIHLFSRKTARQSSSSSSSITPGMTTRHCPATRLPSWTCWMPSRSGSNRAETDRLSSTARKLVFQTSVHSIVDQHEPIFPVSPAFDLGIGVIHLHLLLALLLTQTHFRSTFMT